MPKSDTKITAKTEKAKEEFAEARENNVKPGIFPRVTEKAYAEQVKNTYIFEVPLKSEKLAIKRALEGQFGVTITSIRTLVRSGKPTRYSRGKHAYPGKTSRRNRKYAYITLKSGDKIHGIFEEEDSANNTKDTKKGDN